MYVTKSVGDGGLGLEAATAAIRSCLAFSSLSYPQQNPHVAGDTSIKVNN
jgi:hypothetical protein